MGQVVRVLLPGDAPGPVVPTALQASPNRTLIKAWLKHYVVEDRRQGRPKYTGANHKLTVEHILDMINVVDKKCVVCSVNLLFQDYTKCHRQTFSIDRLDDRQGHYLWNVRITCLSCNRQHKCVDYPNDIKDFPDNIYDPNDEDYPDGVDYLDDIKDFPDDIYDPNDVDDRCQFW